MFRRARFLLLLIAFLAAAPSTWAGYFIDIPAEKKEPVRPLPFFLWGGTFDIGFYLNSFDAGASMAGEFRVHRHWSVDLMAGYLIDGELLEFGSDVRFYFTGAMMESGFNDFLRLGVTGLVFEKADKNYVSPRISLGYGRDFMPLKKADFLCRLELRFSYLLGEDIAFEEGWLYHHARLVTYLGIGVFVF